MNQLSENKWIILILSFVPLILCLPGVENLFCGAGNENVIVKNSMFSYGIVFFFLIFISAVLCHAVDYLGDFSKYLNTLDGKIHVLSFIVCTIIIFCFYGSFIFLGDDANYRSLYEKKSIADSLVEFYLISSPTIIIQSTLFAFVLRSLWYGRILLALMVMFGAECAIQIAIPKNKRRYSGLIYLSFFLIPQAMYSDAGWCATSMNYVWPISASLFVILVLKKIIEGSKIDSFTKTITVLFHIFACNCIQCSVCLFLLLCIVVVYEVINEKKSLSKLFSYLKENPFIVVLCVVAFCSLLSNSLCPGNSIRYNYSVTLFYPTFNQLSLLDKVVLGFINSMSNLYATVPNNLITLPLFMSLLFLLWHKMDKFNVVLLILIIVVFFILFLSNKFGINAFDLLQNKTVKSLSAYSSGQIYLEVLAYICLLCIVIFTIFRNLNNKFMAVFIILLILAGVGSGVIIGFSPTIYTSGIRTLLLSSVCFLLSATLLFFETAKEFKFGNLYYTVILLCAILFSLALSKFSDSENSQQTALRMEKIYDTPLLSSDLEYGFCGVHADA